MDKQVELEPGEYTVAATPVEAGYATARYGVTVKPGTLVPLVLEFKLAVPDARPDAPPLPQDAAPRAPEPSPGPAPGPAPGSGAAPGTAPSGAAPSPPAATPAHAAAAAAAGGPGHAAVATAAAPGAAAPPSAAVAPATPAPEPAPPAEARPPEPARPPPPATWSAVIHCTEPGVEIQVGGKRVGVTPDVVIRDLPHGQPLVGQARKDGFEILDFRAANPDRKAAVGVNLPMIRRGRESPWQANRSGTAPKGMGKLVCSTSPNYGAEIIIDGKPTGLQTPIPASRALELPQGKHQVVFRLGGRSTPPQDFVLGEEHRADALLVFGRL